MQISQKQYLHIGPMEWYPTPHKIILNCCHLQTKSNKLLVLILFCLYVIWAHHICCCLFCVYIFCSYLIVCKARRSCFLESRYIKRGLLLYFIIYWVTLHWGSERGNELWVIIHLGSERGKYTFSDFVWGTIRWKLIYTLGFYKTEMNIERSYDGVLKEGNAHWVILHWGSERGT